jgi:hypothetical protein
MIGDTRYLCAGSSVRSTTAALGAFVWTDSMPFSGSCDPASSSRSSSSAGVEDHRCEVAGKVTFASRDPGGLVVL